MDFEEILCGHSLRPWKNSFTRPKPQAKSADKIEYKYGEDFFAAASAPHFRRRARITQASCMTPRHS
ncbi:hypothetical protein O3G_MSEX004589 [Manduca sexta]|uniref:Uncharacterized protein n=1 Tax=Manduca sexta TaxID=7130 RepID=A0A922CHZ3_MANSE|nr:hypothetical protein O3G_MSEX004589 [Manduca sexta]